MFSEGFEKSFGDTTTSGTAVQAAVEAAAAAKAVAEAAVKTVEAAATEELKQRWTQQ